MNVSPNELRKETVKTLKEIEDLHERMKDSHLITSQLLLAKAQCLNTLTLLNEKK